MSDIEIRNSRIDAADAAFDRKDYAKALSLYRMVLKHDPADTEALVGEALAVMHSSSYQEAIPLFEALLAYMPDSKQLQFLLSEALYRVGRLPEAATRLERLVQLEPGYADAWNRLGRVYMDLEQHSDSNRCLKAALEADPDHVEALCHMGLLMVKFCHFESALKVLQKALSIDPENILALNNMGRTCKMQGRHDEALGWYRKAMEADEGKTFVIDNYLFALSYCADLSPDFIAAEHARLAGYYLPVEPLPPVVVTPASDRKLKIGYLSGDFYTHSVAYFLEPLLQNHDYSRFEVYCYSVGSTSDATTERIRQLPCIWRDMTGMPPEAIAREVRNDRIDVLIDLAGHTADNRLQVFAARSAAVQASWIGYPNTTGLPQMDCYITDALCDPPGMTEQLYSEKLWRLSPVFCCYLPPMEFPRIADLPCRGNGYVTFGSFNNFAKVTDKQLAVWGEILKRVPGSRLYLKSMALGDQSVQRSVHERLAAHGIGPERVKQRIVTKTPLEHLAEYGQVDIALDTFPYHGTTTTCEALWMGTPVITMAGNTHASRVGVSLLTNTGCPELIAATEAEYIDKAVALAHAPERLEQYRQGLRTQLAGSPLLDCRRVTREAESAFQAMFDNLCNKAGKL